MGNNTYSVPTDREIHALENPHRERTTHRTCYPRPQVRRQHQRAWPVALASVVKPSTNGATAMIWMTAPAVQKQPQAHRRRRRKPVSSPRAMTIPPGARAKLPTSSRATAASSLRRARSTASCAAMAVSTLRPVVPRLREAAFRASVSQRPVADGFQRPLRYKPRKALPPAGHPAIRATLLPRRAGQ